MSRVSTKNDLINIQKGYVNERLYLVKPPTTFKCVYVSPKCKDLSNITFASPRVFLLHIKSEHMVETIFVLTYKEVRVTWLLRKRELCTHTHKKQEW